MAMSQLAMFFKKMHFIQFIHIHLGQCKVYRDEFIDRYTGLLDRISKLCAWTLQMLGDFKPTSTFKLDEPEVRHQ